MCFGTDLSDFHFIVVGLIKLVIFWFLLFLRKAKEFHGGLVYSWGGWGGKGVLMKRYVGVDDSGKNNKLDGRHKR